MNYSVTSVKHTVCMYVCIIETLVFDQRANLGPILQLSSAEAVWDSGTLNTKDF